MENLLFLGAPKLGLAFLCSQMQVEGSLDNLIIIWQKNKNDTAVSPELYFKMNGYTTMISYHFYKGKQLLGLPVCFPGQCRPFKIGSTLKGKNLLLGEQILLFKS